MAIRRHLGILVLCAVALLCIAGAAQAQTVYRVGGETHSIAVTATASTPEQITGFSTDSTCNSYVITNKGPDDVYFELAPTAATAVPDIPAGGNPGTSHTVRANRTANINYGNKAFFSAKTDSGTATVLVNCGTGALYESGGGSVTVSSGTVTSNQGTPNTTANNWPVKICDGTDCANVTASNALEVSFSTTDPCASSGTAKNSVVISATADAELVAISASTVIYVCGFSANAAAGTAPSFRFIYGTGAVCATGLTGLTGAYLQSLNGTVNYGGGGQTVMKTAAANALCIDVGGTTPDIRGVLTYVQQ